MNNKTIWSLVLLLLIVVGGIVLWGNKSKAPRQPSSSSNEESVMTEESALNLTSSAFSGNGEIPEKFTCDGENTNPPLSISNVPEDTKSLALIVDDPDIPPEIKESRGITVFDHWVVFNIQPTTDNIQQDSVPGTEGNNSSGELGYTGPCPPKEYQPTEHRYFFKVYALDVELTLSEGATKEDVEQAMEGHVIAESELVGRYDRAK